METRKYRPSNGEEGRWFMGQWCEQCVHDDPDTGCDIILKSMAYHIDEDGYPSEWIYDDNGHPICTNYKRLG